MSTIGAVGSNSMNMQGMHGGRRRPDPAEMAEKLFSKLDTNGQGYIEQSDLQNAFSQIGSTGESGSASDLFAKLDSNSDGKVTKDEFSSALKAAAEELDSQFASMRMQEGMSGSMPPPPPPPGNDAGFTKDELSSQLDEIGSSDSQRASLISDIVQNFDEADTDGDGKVSFKEAMAYDQGQSSATGSTSSQTVAGTEDSSRKLMMQIMQLMHAYNPEGSDRNTAATIITTA